MSVTFLEGVEPRVRRLPEEFGPPEAWSLVPLQGDDWLGETARFFERSAHGARNIDGVRTVPMDADALRIEGDGRTVLCEDLPGVDVAPHLIVDLRLDRVDGRLVQHLGIGLVAGLGTNSR